MNSIKRNVGSRWGTTIFFLIISFFQLQAQKRANNWVFYNYELNFNSGVPIVTRQSAGHLSRGMGVISDDDGGLLFYSDGFSVWNKNHLPMPNGANLIASHGFTSTQESLVIPKPGDPNRFYIFTVDPYNGQSTSGLYYSEVNLSLLGGLGDITVKGVKLVSRTSNKLSAALHENQQDIWVITHEHNTNKYYKLLITSTGISTPTVQQIGVVHTSIQGQLKFSPDGKKVALTSSAGTSLFDFNALTGELSNVMNFTPGSDGLEFSSDATKIYVSDLGGLAQYDISLPTYEEIRDSHKQAGANTVYNSMRQFQLGPDGKIYLTKGGGQVTGTTHLGVVVNPNADAKDVVLQERGLFLNGGDAFVNFTPNFIQNYFFRTSFSFDNNCQAAPINFRVTNTHRLDSVRWFFGEGSTSSSLNPTFRYMLSGDYTVELHAYYGDKATVISRSIKINPYTAFDLGSDTTVCYGSQLSVDDNFVSYQWNTGDTTHWVWAETNREFKLTTKNRFGCAFRDSVNVTVEPLPSINFPDTVRMEQLSSVNLEPGNFHWFAWSTGASTPTISVEDEGWYSVAVKNSFGCLNARSVFVQKHNSTENLPPERWIRLNPLPTGAPGQDSYFFDEKRGFIVTTGEVLQTKDGGATWEIQQKIAGAKRITFKNMIGYVVGDRGVIYKSTHFGEGWNKLNINQSSNENLNAISAPHGDTLFVTSDNKLFKSVNGGKSWTSHTVNINGINIEDSYFVSSKVGHAVCMNGKIIKTEDGGISWRLTLNSNVIPSNFFQVKFINEKVGFATREHDDIFKTIDGGETWKLSGDISDAGYAIQFLNEKVGFLAGEHGAIHKTTDGGATWRWIGFGGARIWANDFHALHFVNENIGFAAGLRGRIVKTLDGGLTWREYGPTYNLINSVEFMTPELGYMASGNTVFKTTNGGFKWENVGRPVPEQATGKLDFINNDIGYAIAGGTYGSSVYKTTNGGKTWSKPHAGELSIDGLSGIYFIDENAGFVMGQGGRKTIDGGKTWSSISGISLVSQMQFISDKIGFARNTNGSSDRIYKSADGGNNWTFLYQSDDDIESFHFLDESVGYIVGDANYKTVDGGVTWQKLSVPYNTYKCVKFLTKEMGYIVDEDGGIFKTVDGGKNWQFEMRSYALDFLGILGDDVFASGEFGALFRSSITLNDLIKLGDPSLVDLTDSTASISSYVKSFTNLSSADLIAEIGTKSGTYDHAVEIETLDGFIDKSVKHKFNRLKSGTTYYCRLKVVDKNKFVVSKQFSFTTLLVTGIQPETLDLQMYIYPNPANQTINVNITNGNKTFTYTVSDLLGRRLLTGSSDAQHAIDISTLRSGTYLFSVSSAEHKKTFRIVKE